MFNKDRVRNQFYNLDVVNKSTLPVQLDYSDSRGTPIIENCDGYSLSILRFTVDLSLVPIMIFPTTESEAYQSPPYTNVDNTRYSITLVDGAGQHQECFVVYYNYGEETPYIYNWNHLCDLLNVAIRLSADFYNINIRVPYFEFNKATASIDLIAPADYDESILGHYTFYVNKPLYDLFCKDFNGLVENLSGGRYYHIFIGGTGSNTTSPTRVVANAIVINATAYTSGAFRMTTPFPNLGNIVACKSIVFTTNQIPMVDEFLNNSLNLQ